MTPRNSDRRRAFADVVAVDAWHEPFPKKKGKVLLYADVVFGTARVGGEDGSKVRFRLAVKAAEVIVVIPANEPVRVDRKSVSRDGIVLRERVKTSTTKMTDSKVHGNLLFHIAADPSASASAGVSGSKSMQEKETRERSGDLPTQRVTQSLTSDGNYRWTVESSSDAPLQGRPWDALKYPRLSLVDERAESSRSIAPVVRLEVHCRREDLLITDLELTDETAWLSSLKRRGSQNRIAAAEEYIKGRLVEEGLSFTGVGDKFGRITLASSAPESE